MRELIMFTKNKNKKALVQMCNMLAHSCETVNIPKHAKF